MPTFEDAPNIYGYFDNSRSPEEIDPSNAQWTWETQSGQPKTLGEILTDPESYRRWPIRNREERTEISAQKRAIIHERDGRICRLCGNGGQMLTIDHIIPRSAFPANMLHIADRSDNLISACWDCNEGKSNYEHPQLKRPGVTASCWHCQNRWYDYDEYVDTNEEDPAPPCRVVAYCGRCGLTHVPSVEGYIL